MARHSSTPVISGISQSEMTSRHDPPRSIVQRLAAVGGGDHLVPGPRQRVPQHLQGHRIVVYDQDSHNQSAPLQAYNVAERSPPTSAAVRGVADPVHARPAASAATDSAGM